MLTIFVKEVYKQMYQFWSRRYFIIKLIISMFTVSKRSEVITKKLILLALRVTITAFKDKLQGCWAKMARSIKDIALQTLGKLCISYKLSKYFQDVLQFKNTSLNLFRLYQCFQY